MLLRAVLLPTEEFEAAALNLNSLKKRFYKEYERSCTKDQCIYNVHCFGEHAETLRDHGPATNTSTFPFEGFFAKFPMYFKPGTTSIGKQILVGALSAILTSAHRCSRSIQVAPKESFYSQQNLFYLFENAKYSFWKCTRVAGETIFAKRFQISDVELYKIHLGRVGCFKNAGLESNEHSISAKRVKGYAIQVDDWLISVPIDCIQEL